MHKMISSEIKHEVLNKAKSGEKVSSLEHQYGFSIKTNYA